MYFNVAMRIFELAYNGEINEVIAQKLKDEFGVNHSVEDIAEITKDVRKKAKSAKNRTSCAIN